ncbi:hypothetical protein LCGC14_0557390 [marine sediment metagenome]|uniref:Uncharacterized protein n=1 Tax=marine sediment metagenome TaxID=412755 RepID=A0A0F9UWA3_9ZZZZ
MPRQIVRQASFGAGEFAPLALGRTDLPQYGAGLKQLSNFIVSPQGSATRRPGFKHIGAAKSFAPVEFTERANPKNFILITVIWAAELKLLVAVGEADGTDAYIITSPDGVTWTERTNPKNFTLNEVVWTGSLLVAVGLADGTDAYIITSPDGITWTERTNPKNFHLISVAWTGSLLVAVGKPDGTDAYIITSPDGVTWTERANPKNFQLQGVTWTGSLLVAVGLADGTDAYIITSPGDVSNHAQFAFSGATGSPYMLEFGQEYIRFIRDEVQLESSPGVAYEVVTPWDAQDVKELQVAQAHDVMYLVHPSYTPRKLERTGEETFTLTDLMDQTTMDVNRVKSTFKLWDGPYLPDNPTVSTMTLSGTGTGSKTLTASLASFVSTDIGRIFRIFSKVDGSNVWGWGVITAYTSTTVVTIFMVEDPSTTSAETRWALGAWSRTTGYPGAISFYGMRLCFANTKTEPMSGWTSIAFSFEEFDPTAVDDTVFADNGITFTVASRRMLPIQWLEAGADLMVGTKGGVFRIDGGPDANFSATAIRVRAASGYGADTPLPALIGEVLIYAQQSKRIVRGLSARETMDVLSQPDMTLLAGHIGKSGIEQMAFSSVPSSIVWMRRADGLLIGLTLNPVTQIVAWHSHQLPGSLTGSDWPEVLSIAVLSIAGHDQLWTIVRRTVNGSTVEHLEAMQLPFDSARDDQEDACYLDAAVYYKGASTTVISGLDHLEGESVSVYADGIKQIDQIVTNNLLLWSEDFTNAVWTDPSAGWSVVANNQTDPNGVASAADTITQDGAASLLIRQSLTIADGSSFSIWVKLLTGTFTGFTIDHGDGTMQDMLSQLGAVGGDWVRVEATAMVKGAGAFLDLQVQGGSGATFSLWGAQFQELPTVSGYIPTQSATVLNVIPLATAASVVWTGLDYESLSNLETLPVKARDLEIAKVKVIATVVEVLDTNGLQMGVSAATLSPLHPSLQPDTWVSGALKPLVTDDREHNWAGLVSTSTRPTVLIRPDGPLPATIIGLTHLIEYDHV